MTPGPGLFGKLRDRRDFVAIDVPRPFLAIWEPWLQAGLAASRRALGEDWPALYLTMPLWRFWLGAALCGTEAVGVVMPSIDGAGRCFPLTIVACCEAGRGIASPGTDPVPDWFAAAEDLLLGTLDADAGLEATKEALAALPGPAAVACEGAALRTSSLWWTRGGAARGPAAFAAIGLPGPEAWTAMIGRERRAAAAPAGEARDGG